MSLERIKDNTVIYNTELYNKYNLYLISKYKEFCDITTKKIQVNRLILELEELLESNTYSPTNPNDITRLLNVVSWEETLVYYYDILHKTNFPLKSIETYLRKLKLEKINNE